MSVSYFNKLPEHLCIQIYQHIFKNVLDELNMIYSEHHHICDVIYSPQYSKIIESQINRDIIKYNYYTMISQCKKGHLSICVDCISKLCYNMRSFVYRVTSYQATRFQQIPDSFIKELFAVRYSSSPIVNRLIMNIDSEHRKEYRHLF